MAKPIVRLRKPAPEDALEELDLGQGVTVWVRPFNTLLHEIAKQRAGVEAAERRAAQALLIEEYGEDGVGMSELPDLRDDAAHVALIKTLTLQHLAVAAIDSWEGCYPEAGDEPLEVSEAAVKALIEQEPYIAQAFELRYTLGRAELLAEGNASGASPNGISATAPGTAETAESKTAEAAPTAPTRSRRRKASKAGSSGSC